MKYQLRDYQKKASDAAVMCFKMKSGRNGLFGTSDRCGQITHHSGYSSEA